jgi:biopolymer transport protein ExbD
MRLSGERHGLIAKINVVPLIDVCLVLVIILLVTAPMMVQSDLPVDLPQARTREAEDERNVSITLSSNGDLAVDNERVSRETLGATLQLRLAEKGNNDVLVVVRADSNAPYVAVREILDQARAAGAQRVAIATRQKTGVER